MTTTDRGRTLPPTAERFTADLPMPGVEPGDPCEGGCGVRVFPAQSIWKPNRWTLVETVPGRPLSFGEEHTPGRCRWLRGLQCCDLHAEPSCCDPDDCGPCCEDCPTCPTQNRSRADA